MRSLGVTLIELLLVLAIVGALLCVGMPALYRDSALSVRRQCVDELAQGLRYARLQALVQQQPLRLTPIVDNNWAHGMRLQVGTRVLRVWTWHHPSTILRWHGFHSNQYLLVENELTQLAMNGYFSIEQAGESLARIVVTRFGRVY